MTLMQWQIFYIFLPRDELHWLDVLDRIFQTRIDSSPVSERTRTTVPVGHCIPVSYTLRHLRFANRYPLAIRVSGSTLMTVGLFQLPAQQSIELSPGFHSGPDTRY